MKNLTSILIICLLVLIPLTGFGQSSISFSSPYEGRWEGYADSPEGSLVVNLEIKNGIVSGFIDDSIILGRFDVDKKPFIRPLYIKRNKVTPIIGFMSPNRIEGTYIIQAHEYKWLLVKSAADRSDVIISNITVNEKEPWTGKWKVESASDLNGVWAMKQEGKIVQSTRNSWFEFKGKVQGNQLDGRFEDPGGNNLPFTIEMHSEGMSFNGSLDYYGGRRYILKGKRIE
jgi:hypothetical protein